jgi:hypothetical protein
MILLIVVALAILIALLRGGQMARLAEIEFRHGWAGMLAVVLQIVMVYADLPSERAILNPRIGLLLASYALLVWVVIANLRLPGLALIGVGLLLNLTVMVANDGFMPVSAESLERAGLSHLVEAGSESATRVRDSKDAVLSREEANVWFLGDIFVTAHPMRSVFSIGDVFLALGALMLFQRTMVTPATTPCTKASVP